MVATRWRRQRTYRCAKGEGLTFFRTCVALIRTNSCPPRALELAAAEERKGAAVVCDKTRRTEEAEPCAKEAVAGGGEGAGKGGREHEADPKREQCDDDGRAHFGRELLVRRKEQHKGEERGERARDERPYARRRWADGDARSGEDGTRCEQRKRGALGGRAAILACGCAACCHTSCVACAVPRSDKSR